jgi:hypothetical protein
MRKEKTNTPENEQRVNSTRKNAKGRHPEFETPSQRRNRDGLGRGQNGSDGDRQIRGSNH